MGQLSAVITHLFEEQSPRAAGRHEAAKLHSCPRSLPSMPTSIARFSRSTIQRDSIAGQHAARSSKHECTGGFEERSSGVRSCCRCSCSRLGPGFAGAFLRLHHVHSSDCASAVRGVWRSSTTRESTKAFDSKLEVVEIDEAFLEEFGEIGKSNLYLCIVTYC